MHLRTASMHRPTPERLPTRRTPFTPRITGPDSTLRRVTPPSRSEKRRRYDDQRPPAQREPCEPNINPGSGPLEAFEIVPVGRCDDRNQKSDRVEPGPLEQFSEFEPREK